MPIINITGEIDQEAMDALPELADGQNVTITLTANVGGKVTTESGSVESYTIGQVGSDFTIDSLTVN